MLTESEIEKLVEDYGEIVSGGRSIKEIIANGYIPRLSETSIAEGKVSDSVFGYNLVTKKGISIWLMYRTGRVSTHDKVRGSIPFKDQVLAINHDMMHEYLKDILGSSQFNIPGLATTSCIIASEKLTPILFENVFRKFNAKTDTSTSLYVHWLKAKNEGLKEFVYAGHTIHVDEIEENGELPYIMDTPSTKSESDKTIDPQYLFDNDICTPREYSQLKKSGLEAFVVAEKILKERKIQLVDTKLEAGKDKSGRIKGQDEWFTMDSSRYWLLNSDGSIKKDENGNPIQMSKQYARDMEPEEGQFYSPKQKEKIAIRYIEGLQHLTGKTFKPDLRPREERIIESTNLILDYLL